MTEAETDQSTTPKTKGRLGAAYTKLFAASTISNIGDGIGTIAYPWLASAVTRNGFLIALVAVVQRLPWLLFSLPAGVITDRSDRRRLMIGANWVRAILTLFVSFAVLNRQGSLLSPDELDAAATPNEDFALFAMVLVATLFLGMAEVLHDNAAQTFMPAIVAPENLERANGRLWSAEMVANTFLGPPLAAALLVVAFAVPFFVDAASFAIAAILVSLILPKTMLRPTTPPPTEDRKPWKSELAEGFHWLWNHDLFRPMAIILGFLNLLGTLAMATLVLYGQEVLGTSPTEFAILSTGGAVGGVVGGWTASKVAERIGSGPSLGVTLVGGGFITIAIGLSSVWPAVWVLFAIFTFTAVLWNVITVSLRQTVIPDELLGRVNSVYRFFAWGMMPIGAILAGVIISVGELITTRETALRLPWLIAGAAHFVLFAFARTRLTTEKMEHARAEAVASREDEPEPPSEHPAGE
jgi:MFS family permease